MNTKQSAEEAAKQIEEPVKWTYQTVESLYGCTLNPLAAVKVADAHNAAIEKATKPLRNEITMWEKKRDLWVEEREALSLATPEAAESRAAPHAGEPWTDEQVKGTLEAHGINGITRAHNATLSQHATPATINDFICIHHTDEQRTMMVGTCPICNRLASTPATDDTKRLDCIEVDGDVVTIRLSRSTANKLSDEIKLFTTIMSQTKEKPMNTKQIAEEAAAEWYDPKEQSGLYEQLKQDFIAAIEKAKKQWIANLSGEKKHSMGEGANEAQRLRAHIPKYAAHASEKGSQ